MQGIPRRNFCMVRPTRVGINSLASGSLVVDAVQMRMPRRHYAGNNGHGMLAILATGCWQ